VLAVKLGVDPVSEGKAPQIPWPWETGSIRGRTHCREKKVCGKKKKGEVSKVKDTTEKRSQKPMEMAREGSKKGRRVLGRTRRNDVQSWLRARRGSGVHNLPPQTGKVGGSGLQGAAGGRGKMARPSAWSLIKVGKGAYSRVEGKRGIPDGGKRPTDKNRNWLCA